MIDTILVLLVVEWVLLCYITSIWGEFVFDDLLIAENVRYVMHKRKSYLTLHWGRALLWMTYHRDVLSHGWKETGWHVTNVAIHAVSSAAMYGILRYWFADEFALAGALVYVSHPLGTASVSSISGRSGALCGMFQNLALLAFVSGAYMLVPMFAFAGFKSKEDIVTFPLVLGAVWWWG